MEEYKCPLCKGEYNQCNPPRLLTMCGHTYCHHCIKTIMKRKDHKYTVRCPDDHLTISLQTNSPSHFPKNIVLLDAVRRQNKPKEQSYEANQFLPDHVVNLKKSTMMSQSRSSLVGLKESLLGLRRMSIDEGICLLHHKPLDIVCIQEKIHICAQCALFGLHKGHSFTTIKEILQKNKDWSNKITEIIEQKQHIDTKVLNGQFQKEISSILSKKRDILLDEINNHFARIKEKIDQCEKNIKKQLQQNVQKVQAQLGLIMAISPKLQEDFLAWACRVGEKLNELDQANDSSIITVDQKDEDLLHEGNMMLQSMKNELILYWSKVQSALQYPKLIYSHQIEQQLQKLIKFQLLDNSPLKNSQLTSLDVTNLEDFSIVENKQGLQILQEVSLLDISKFQQSQTMNNINFSQISFVNEPVYFKPNEKLAGKSEILPQKRMKRVKSRELNLNMSLVNSSEKTMTYKSPKDKLKTQIISRKNISSPTSPKARLRRLVLKVKDPQKFEKIISSLQADNIDNIDVTGFEMGDEVARQLCLKIKECKRPKMLRLMKNSLSDESAKQVVESLRTIDYLNLAQNCFTDKIFDPLLELARSGLGRQKTIQLGQNRINSRRLKDKIEQLRKFGVTITL